MYDMNNPQDVIKVFKDGGLDDDEIIAICNKVIEWVTPT